MLRQHNSPTEQRRGVILMVVLALLTLFAIVGITFAFYAQKSHAASVNFRVAWQLAYQNGAGSGGGGGGPPNIDASVLLKFALAQLIYDVPDLPAGSTLSGAGSALRGHSLSRNLYGYNDQALNTQPFNGTGRLRYTSILTQDDYNLINYTYFQTDGIMRDPEHYGTRTDPTATRTAPFVGSANPPYSYPDPNFMALGAARADGTNLINSFYRSWIFGSLAPATTNNNWTSPQGKHMILRPRPADNDPSFPYPDAYGDVKNKDGSSNNDSLWMDMGYQPTPAADGTLFKPLFAWRVEDLDGKINYNTAGNRRGLNGTHASHEGWGKWEMSLAQLFTANATEWQNIFLGSPTSTVRGRYGADGQPGKSGSSASSGKSTRFDSQVDYDGSNEQASGAPTARLVLPAGLSPFPTFPQGFGNGSAAELLNHPMLYDYFYPFNPVTGSDDGALLVSDVEYLLYGGAGAATNPEVMNAQVAQLCPQNFRNNARLQGLVTPLSMDLDRMGLSPWLFNRQTTPYGYPTGSTPLVQAPSTTPVSFPASTTFGTPPTTPPSTNSDFDVNWRAAFATLEKIDLRQNPPSYPHQIPVSGAVTPTQYYSTRFDAAAATAQTFVAAQTYRQNLADQIYRRLLIVTGAPQPSATPTSLLNPTTTAADLQALAVLRWLGQLAVNMVDFIDEDEISTPFNYYATAYNFFTALNTGTAQTFPATSYAQSSGSNLGQYGPPSTTTPPPAFVPEQAYTYWVFGTELPRVVLNEVNTEYTVPPAPAANQPIPPFNVNVWAELYCPFPAALNPNNQPVQAQDNQITTPIPLYMPAGGATQPAYSPYKVVIADNNYPTTGATVGYGPLYIPSADLSGNAAGIPNYVRNETTFLTPTTPVVGPGNPVPTGIASGTYFLVGPGQDSATSIASPRVPATTPWYQSPNMSYTVNQTQSGTTTVWKLGPTSGAGNTITDNTTGITVLLRRLANPHLPFNDNPLASLVVGGVTYPPGSGYNPYVTVDYLSPLPLNNSASATKMSPNHSYGKLQPYASDNTAVAGVPAPTGNAKSQVQPNTNTAPTVNGQTTVQHTFGLLTGNNPNVTTGGGKASWLVHLDRQPNNPMELLQVSGFRPWQLTQQFIVQNTPFQHRVQWFDQDMTGTSAGRSHLLYRLFGFLETSDRATGVYRSGRVPGRVNINTIWDPEVLMALLDPQSSNYFTAADVYLPTGGAQTVWKNLVNSRTPGLPPFSTTGGSISGSDRPFLDMAAAFLPSTDPWVQNQNRYGSIQDTLFRASNPTGQPLGARLFQPTSAVPNHPYLQYEMLTKLYNNVTNRSNTFAVWLTVGFFKVTDPTTTPPKLGAEIGASTGTNIRHRFFCVVDRSQVVISGLNGYLAQSAHNVQGMPPLPPGVGMVTTAQLGTPTQVFLMPKTSPADRYNSIHGTIGYYNGGQVPWQFQAGSQVVVDRGLSTEEVVTILAADKGTPPDLGTYGAAGQTAPSITAIFNRPHKQGFTLDIYGNPGPQPWFDPYLYPQAYAPVVPVVRIVQ